MLGTFPAQGLRPRPTPGQALQERSPTPLTTDILERIGALYAVEAEVRGQPPDIRCCVRQERSKPLVDALREILHTALRRLSPKSDMARAIAYGTKRWPALCRFLDDGRLEIDNNIAERAGWTPQLSVRRFSRRRRAGRGYLHRHPDPGLRRGRLCKANGVNPQAYIADVIARVAGDWPASRWDEPMPWNWSGEPARLAA